MKNKRQQLIDRLEKILVKRRDGLLRSLNGELGQFRTFDERVVGDSADAAIDSDYGLVNSQLAQTESRELRAIMDALRKIRTGSYGECEICEKPIPIARLEALPYATTCVDCQRMAESERARSESPAPWSSGRDDRDYLFENYDVVG